MRRGISVIDAAVREGEAHLSVILILSDRDSGLSGRVWAPVGMAVEVSVDGVCRTRNERYYYRTFEADNGYLVVNLHLERSRTCLLASRGLGRRSEALSP